MLGCDGAFCRLCKNLASSSRLNSSELSKAGSKPGKPYGNVGDGGISELPNGSGICGGTPINWLSIFRDDVDAADDCWGDWDVLNISRLDLFAELVLLLLLMLMLLTLTLLMLVFMFFCFCFGSLDEVGEIGLIMFWPSLGGFEYGLLKLALASGVCLGCIKLSRVDL